MLYQLTATDWRLLCRLVSSGGRLDVNDLLEGLTETPRRRACAVLQHLGLATFQDDAILITERGRQAQILGELDVSDEELIGLPTMTVIRSGGFPDPWGLMSAAVAVPTAHRSDRRGDRSPEIPAEPVGPTSDR